MLRPSLIDGGLVRRENAAAPARRRTRSPMTAAIITLALGCLPASHAPAQNAEPPLKLIQAEIGVWSYAYAWACHNEIQGDLVGAKGSETFQAPCIYEYCGLGCCVEEALSAQWGTDGILLAANSLNIYDAWIFGQLLVRAPTAVSWHGGEAFFDFTSKDCQPMDGYADGTQEYPLICDLGVRIEMYGGVGFPIGFAGSAEVLQLALGGYGRTSNEPPSDKIVDSWFDAAPDGLDPFGVWFGAKAETCMSVGHSEAWVQFGGISITIVSSMYGDYHDYTSSAGADIAFKIALGRPHAAIISDCCVYGNGVCLGLCDRGCGLFFKEQQISYCFSGDGHPILLSAGGHDLRATFPWDHGYFSSSATVRFFRLNPADVKYDGIVDADDIAVVLGSWGGPVDPARTAADVNMDGQVDGLDLALVVGAWGTDGCMPIPGTDIGCP